MTRLFKTLVEESVRYKIHVLYEVLIGVRLNFMLFKSIRLLATYHHVRKSKNCLLCPKVQWLYIHESRHRRYANFYEIGWNTSFFQGFNNVHNSMLTISWCRHFFCFLTNKSTSPSRKKSHEATPGRSNTWIFLHSFSRDAICILYYTASLSSSSDIYIAASFKTEMCIVSFIDFIATFRPIRLLHFFLFPFHLFCSNDTFILVRWMSLEDVRFRRTILNMC